MHHSVSRRHHIIVRDHNFGGCKNAKPLVFVVVGIPAVDFVVVLVNLQRRKVNKLVSSLIWLLRAEERMNRGHFKQMCWAGGFCR